MVSTAQDRFNLVPGEGIKFPCRMAANGDTVLTGLQTIDGVVGAENDRVLLPIQADATENGIWVMQLTAWVRASDWDDNSDVVSGMLVTVSEGTLYGGVTWKGVFTGTFAIDTTEVAFSGASIVSGGDDLRYGPVFATVAAMTAASPVPIDGVAVVPSEGMMFSTTAWRGGWAATVRGPLGGANYVVVSKADHDVIRNTSTVSEQGDHTLDNGLVALIIFDTPNAMQFGGYGNGVDIDSPAIQAAIDVLNGSRWAVYVPQGDYVINVPIDIKKANLFSDSNSRNCVVRTNGSFQTATGFQMVRNWQDSWYAGAESRVAAPADLTAFSGDLNRYVNIRNIYFICADADLTIWSFVAQQETSGLKNCNLHVGTAVGTRYAIWLDNTPAGAAIALNDSVMRDIVIYGDDCVGVLKAEGSGNGLLLEHWNIGSLTCTESPINTNAIDVKLKDFHCEAAGPVGGYLIDVNSSEGVTVDRALFLLKDVAMGGIVKYTPNPTSGSNRSIPSLSHIQIQNAAGGGLTANMQAMLILKDNSNLADEYPIKYPDYDSIGHVYSITPRRVVADTADEVIDFSEQSGNVPLAGNASLISGSPVPLPIKVSEFKYFSHWTFRISGRNESNGGPFVIEGTVAAGVTSGAAYQTRMQIDKELNTLGTVTIVRNGGTGFAEVLTTEAGDAMTVSDFSYVGLAVFSDIMKA
jgi:hypothetical protein